MVGEILVVVVFVFSQSHGRYDTLSPMYECSTHIIMSHILSRDYDYGGKDGFKDPRDEPGPTRFPVS